MLVLKENRIKENHVGLMFVLGPKQNLRENWKGGTRTEGGLHSQFSVGLNVWMGQGPTGLTTFCFRVFVVLVHFGN